MGRGCEYDRQAGKKGGSLVGGKADKGLLTRDNEESEKRETKKHMSDCKDRRR